LHFFLKKTLYFEILKGLRAQYDEVKRGKMDWKKYIFLFFPLCFTLFFKSKKKITIFLFPQTLAVGVGNNSFAIVKRLLSQSQNDMKDDEVIDSFFNTKKKEVFSFANMIVSFRID
jgi:hypothetical protein